MGGGWGVDVFAIMAFLPPPSILYPTAGSLVLLTFSSSRGDCRFYSSRRNCPASMVCLPTHSLPIAPPIPACASVPHSESPTAFYRLSPPPGWLDYDFLFSSLHRRRSTLSLRAEQTLYLPFRPYSHPGSIHPFNIPHPTPSPIPNAPHPTPHTRHPAPLFHLPPSAFRRCCCRSSYHIASPPLSILSTAPIPAILTPPLPSLSNPPSTPQQTRG